MTVSELIAVLQTLPQTLPVRAWDGDYGYCLDISFIDVNETEVNLFTLAQISSAPAPVVKVRSKWLDEIADIIRRP